MPPTASRRLARVSTRCRSSVASLGSRPSGQLSRACRYVSYEYLAAWAYSHELGHVNKTQAAKDHDCGALGHY